MSIPRQSPEQAAEQIYRTLLREPRSEKVAIASACDRTLTRDLTAPISLPPFDASAMDGFAFDRSRIGGRQTLKLVGTALAGHPFNGRVGAAECVRITTGAALPRDTNTVVIQEDVVLDAGHVAIQAMPAIGDNVRRAGNDVAAGALLHRAGTRLNAFHCGALAASGIAEVTVATQPRVAVFSTGDELVPAGAELGPGQIYDSNRLLVAALIDTQAVTLIDGGLLPDDPKVLSEALGAVKADLLVTSGGVSVGDADFLTDLLQAEGTLSFWRLNLKPGKPLAFGSFRETPFLGLPGNPVSTAITALLFLPPAIAALTGAPKPSLAFLPATLATPVRRRSGREEYQRGTVENQGGKLVVRSTGDQSSNRLSSFSEANCLIRLRAEQGDLAVGTPVEIVNLFGLL